jgi:hypothetical protein
MPKSKLTVKKKWVAPKLKTMLLTEVDAHLATCIKSAEFVRPADPPTCRGLGSCSRPFNS